MKATAMNYPRIESSILTGSHVYGKPRPDSDMDIVMVLNEEALALLKSKADTWFGLPNGDSLHFGHLNVIATTDEGIYRKWVAAMYAARSERPVTKDRAIELHEKYGIPRVDGGKS